MTITIVHIRIRAMKSKSVSIKANITSCIKSMANTTKSIVRSVKDTTSNPFIRKTTGFLCLIIATFIAMLLYGFYTEGKELRKYEALNREIVADKLLEDNQADEALTLYLNIDEEVSKYKEPKLYADIQVKIGDCYQQLATIGYEDYNLPQSIKAYEAALTVYSPKEVIPGKIIFDYPLQYAATQNKLGETYLAFAEFLDSEDNVLKAITAHEEALKVYSEKSTDELEYPLEYARARTQNKLGKAYRALAEFRDREDNLRKVIQFTEEAINTYQSITLDIESVYEIRFEYAETQKLLGEAYLALAEVKDKGKNAANAIVAFENAAIIYSADNYTILHDEVMSNIEKARRMLE